MQGAAGGFLVYPGGKRRKGVEFRGSVVERARWQGERSGGEKTERRGCDELTTLRSGAPPRCTADTCQLIGLLGSRRLGELAGCGWCGRGDCRVQ